MTILRLAIDAAGMRAGAAEAQRALSEVGRAGEAAAQGVEQTNRALQQTGDIYGGGSRVFRDTQRAVVETGKSFDGLQRSIVVTSEALQIGGRVRAVGQEFAALGQGMGSISALSLNVAAGLLDVVQVTRLLKAEKLAEQGAEAASGFGKFFALLSGNPLLVASVAITGIAGAMSLFSGNTEKARQAQDALNKSLAEFENRKLDVKFRQNVGLPVSAQEVAQEEIRRLGTLSRDITTAGQPVTIAQLAKDLGVSEEGLRNRLRPSEVASVSGSFDLSAGGVGGFGLRPKDGVSPLGAQRLIEDRARLFARVPEAAAARTFGGEFTPPEVKPVSAQQETYRGDTEALREYLDSLRQETQLLGLSQDEREQSIALINAEQIAKQNGLTIDGTIRDGIREQITLQQQLQQAQELARASGEIFGTAFFSIVNGANSARQAVAQLVQQLAALAQGQAIKGLGNAFAGLFAPSSQQASSTPALGTGPGPWAGGYVTPSGPFAES